MGHKTNYIFTNKRHSKKGIMSTVLGTLSIVSILLAIYLTFSQKGISAFNYGIAVFLSALFSFVGMWLGVVAKMEKNKFYLFPLLGIVTNLFALAGVSFILYAGAYGL